MEKGNNTNALHDFLRKKGMKANSSPEALLSKLSDADKQKVQNILNDREALEKILKSDAAKEIMKNLGKNGF